VKIGGSLAGNARFAAPTCLVSSCWFSCGLAVSMGEAAKPLLFEGFQAGCHVVLRGTRGTLLHSNLFDNVSKVLLCGWRNNALHTLHSTLYTPHSKLHTPHSTRHTPPRSTLLTLNFTLHTPHFTLHTPPSTLHTLHFPLHTPLHSTLHNLQFRLLTPHSTL